ncbi:DNA polymerase III subunit alpha [bacterium]|nr:DNA polymerase III subunit alpha [bacterium]
MFVHLHLHSAFSLLEGTFSVPQLLFRLEDLQMPMIALTDTNAFYGAIQFYQFAKQIGVKPILGCCLRSQDGEAVLLAKNKKGFSQISEIITARHLVEKFSLRKDLQKIAYTSDPQIFVISQDETLLTDLAVCWDHNHLYAELVRNQEEGNAKTIRRLRELASFLRIGVVATNDVHFLHSNDFFLHRVFTAIQKQSHIHARLPLASADSRLKTEQEMEELFQDIPEAIHNTAIIAEQCSVDLEIGKTAFPEFSVPTGESSWRFFERLCREGLERRYGSAFSGAPRERLNHEMKVIRDLGFVDYFLAVWDVLRYAKEKRISWVGRGSVACSIVSYALDITNVDPIRYDLYFERFLNAGRKSPPDIDLDFGWKVRDEILAYVYERYGHDRVAMICSYVTFTARLAVREIGKALGLPDDEITAVSSRIPWGADAQAVLEDKNQFPETRDLPLEQEPFPLILKLAAHINGFPRHLSIHAGGIVIAPYPITQMIPLERSTKGLVVTQYDMYGVEDIGLVKIDLLAQRSLSVLDDVIASLRAKGTSLDSIHNHESLYEDEAVKEKIRTADTMGCFYIESPSMRGLLQKLKVTSFEDLTAASSVIRPGVAESGMMQQYIRRKTGEELVEYLHPKMEMFLKETCGVMIYQEDVMRVAHEVGGMSMEEADQLRRAMSGKERSSRAMDDLEKQFIEKAMERDVQNEIATEIWRQISTFASYAFCKAHSASYAQLSFQVAYLRAYHPAEFMAAVLSNQGGFYSTMAYIEEARRMRLRLRLPDVLKGELCYTADGPCGIRVGLMQIKNIATRHLESFLEERARRPFENFADFLLRTEFNDGELETLIKCGACDSFGMNRPQLLWLMKAIFSSAVSQRKQSDLIGASILHLPRLPRLRDYTDDEKLRWEMELMDIGVTKHPLHLYKPWKHVKGYVPAKLLSEYKGQRVRVIGWHVTAKPASTKKGERMMFVSFEDTECLFEATFFPRAYDRFGHLFTSRGPYLIEGTVEEDHSVFTINVNSLKLITAKPPGRQD